MKKLQNLMLALALIATAATSAFAQGLHPDGYKPYPYVFIGAQGGAQTTFTDYDQTKLITPTAAVQLGAMFTPVVGTRLHVGGIWNKGGIHNLGEYEYKYVTSDLDVMLNLANIFYPTNAPHFFNPYLVGGVGLGYAWDNDDFTSNPEMMKTAPLAWTKDRYVHNFRVGALFEFNVCKHLGVNIEIDANNYHDRYNSKTNGRGDWQLTAMAGLTYKFGFKKATAPEPVVIPEPVVVPEPEPVVEPEPIVEPEPEVKPEPQPEVKPEPQPEVKAPENTEISVYYNIGKSTPKETEASKIATFAGWLKAHPEAKASLVGYADAGTGNAEINARLAKQRAERVKKTLVEKYGIDASRIKTDSKGDTVQPYPNNDDNRVVMGVAAE
ncbi:MAG: OmpA family protein [Bacteroidaceae bacterium]|nr:OmpA family protein [Bacteroidaceae bacterium]